MILEGNPSFIYIMMYCTFKKFFRLIHYPEGSIMKRGLDFGFASLLLLFVEALFIGGVYGLSY